MNEPSFKKSPDTGILPRTNREVLEHLIENGAKENYVRRIAYEMGEDLVDEKYGWDFRRAEIGVKNENELLNNQNEDENSN